MSSPLDVKRRRLNDSVSRLSKPFVSPLRSPKPSAPAFTASNKENEPSYNNDYLPSTLAHGTRIPSRLRPTSYTSSRTSATSTPAKRKQPSFPTATTRHKRDPAEAALDRDISTTERAIRATRSDIDTLAQAHRLTTSTTDADIEILIQKWKHVSQTAAEELFGTVKERVNRMGGVQAWRDAEKAKHERLGGFGGDEAEPEDDDADCEFDSQGEELPEDEVAWRKKMKGQARKEMLDAADLDGDDGGGGGGGGGGGDEVGGWKEKQVWAEGGADDDEFTMDMMLRSLNIELGVIGYDKELQRWVA